MIPEHQRTRGAAVLGALLLSATTISSLAQARQSTTTDRKGDLMLSTQVETYHKVAPVIPKPRLKPPVPPAPKPLFAACTNLPASLKIAFKPLPPILHFDGCAQDRPLLLTGLAQSTRVDIKPPATTNCAMTQALGRWLKQSVQPLAHKLFKSPVVQITNISSYACRNRNNRPYARMSEHAFANALDVAGFLLASGDRVRVKQHWNEDSRKARFLYAIHRQACLFFGTVLGPEANALHHDHFHLDMANRRRNYCE